VLGQMTAHTTPRPEARRRDSSLGIVIVIVALLTVFVSQALGQPTVVWSACVVVVGLLVWQRAGTVVTPALLPMAVLLVVAIFGYRSNEHPSTKTGSSYYIFVGQQLSESTFVLICTGAIAIGLGALITLPGPRGVSRIKVEIPAEWMSRLLVFSAVPTLLTVYSIGWGPLLDRAHYLVGGKGGLGSIASVLTLATAVIYGYLWSATRGGKRVASGLGAVALLLVFFALGSRRMALFPALFAIGYALHRRSRRSFYALIVVIAISTWLLRVPLYLRGGTSHGLIPYAHNLGSALTAPSAGSSITSITSSYPIIAATAYLSPHYPASWLLIELNPAPGHWAGWYNIAPTLGAGINNATPYSGIGELGSHGTVATVLVLGLTGMVLGYFERRIRHFAAAGRPFLGIAYLGLVGLFSIELVQYYLRTSYRPLYYIAAIDLVLLIAPGVIGIPRKRALFANTAPSNHPDQQPVQAARGHTSSGS
jgi:hypothetical protein